MDDVPICDAIGHLGITTSYPEGELIDTAIVLYTTVDEAGKVGLHIAWPKGQNWLTRYGMLQASAEVENYDTLTNSQEE